MVCEKCGEELPKAAMFCTNCGWKTTRWKSEVRKSKKAEIGTVFAVAIGVITFVCFVLFFLANI